MATFSSLHCQDWTILAVSGTGWFLTNDKPHHSVEINGKFLVSDLLTDLVGDIRGQNFHECFTSKLSHQIVLKKK